MMDRRQRSSGFSIKVNPKTPTVWYWGSKVNMWGPILVPRLRNRYLPISGAPVGKWLWTSECKCGCVCMCVCEPVMNKYDCGYGCVRSVSMTVSCVHVFYWMSVCSWVPVCQNAVFGWHVKGGVESTPKKGTLSSLLCLMNYVEPF